MNKSMEDNILCILSMNKVSKKRYSQYLELKEYLANRKENVDDLPYYLFRGLIESYYSLLNEMEKDK